MICFIFVVVIPLDINLCLEFFLLWLLIFRFEQESLEYKVP